MKKHNGMRPQDIVILLKIATLQDKSWHAKDLAHSLNISASEVSESLHRSQLAQLIAADKRQIMKRNLLDFIEFGLRYVFPAEQGAIQRGMATAISGPPLNRQFSSELGFVWPWAEGLERGQAIEPLHPGVPYASSKDMALYEMLTLIDAIRLNRSREAQAALLELRRRILQS
jgi:hypothetical protein